MWQKGDKSNNGVPELNSSSIGMAKVCIHLLSALNATSFFQSIKTK